jgi:hypothetical protein
MNKKASPRKNNKKKKNKMMDVELGIKTTRLSFFYQKLEAIALDIYPTVRKTAFTCNEPKGKN